MTTVGSNGFAMLQAVDEDVKTTRLIVSFAAATESMFIFAATAKEITFSALVSKLKSAALYLIRMQEYNL